VRSAIVRQDPWPDTPRRRAPARAARAAGGCGSEAAGPQDGEHEAGRALGLERLPPGHYPHHGTEGEDVRPGVGVGALDCSGAICRNVPNIARRGNVGGDVGCAARSVSGGVALANPKSTSYTRLRDHDIARRVAMHNARAMRPVERVGNLDRVGERSSSRAVASRAVRPASCPRSTPSRGSRCLRTPDVIRADVG
jgi:hypothetical protein